MKYLISKNEHKQVVIRKGGEYVVELVGEGADVEILGGFSLGGDENVKVDLLVVHKASNTKANTLIKAVVGGNANIIIKGKIMVAKDAQLTESYLQERVLLTSDKAKATAIPDLEIFANEVKCSHAATVGSIDKEQLFYLTSRGISKGKASKMIEEGFLREVFSKIQKID